MTSIRGFTLVELIMVIVIMGILASVAAVFIAGPVAGYVDTNRRAQLSDSADIAMRRLSRDLRLALPNSVRVGGGNQFLEYIPTTGGGRYLAESGNFLNFTVAANSFDYLGESLSGATGFVVVFNTGQRSVAACAAPGGADAYEGCNRTAITSIVGNTVNMTAKRFWLASPVNRFHVVPATGPVILACELVNTVSGNGMGTLKIYSSYNTGSGDWGNAAPSAAPVVAGTVTSNLLAQFVSDCNFTYTPGITASNGLVTMRLALTRNNETVVLQNQVHVDAAP